MASKPQIVHLVPAGRRLGVTACGLKTETPERPWRPGLLPDDRWMGPLAEITCENCIGTLEFPVTAEYGVYAQ